MGFTKEVGLAQLNHLFGKAVYTPPSPIYAGVSSRHPITDAIAEPWTNEFSTGYARVELDVSDWGEAFLLGTDETPVIQNATDIVFPKALVDWYADPYAVNFFLLFGSVNNSDLIAFGQFSKEIAVAKDDVLILEAQEVTLLYVV